jgi:hypothetical protein
MMKEAITASPAPLVVGSRPSHVHMCTHACNSPYCDEPRETDCEKCGGPLCGGPISGPQRTWGRA